jgi:hypothetical protein
MPDLPRGGPLAFDVVPREAAASAADVDVAAEAHAVQACKSECRAPLSAVSATGC